MCSSAGRAISATNALHPPWAVPLCTATADFEREAECSRSFRPILCDCAWAAEGAPLPPVRHRMHQDRLTPQDISTSVCGYAGERPQLLRQVPERIAGVLRENALSWTRVLRRRATRHGMHKHFAHHNMAHEFIGRALQATSAGRRQCNCHISKIQAFANACTPTHGGVPTHVCDKPPGQECACMRALRAPGAPTWRKGA